MFPWTRSLVRFGLALTAAAVAGISLAQTGAEPTKLTADTKQAVLKAMERTITRSAYVPGVDFNKWPDFLAGQQEAIDGAETEFAFVQAVNKALQNFGFSHIVLFPPDFGKQRMTQTRAGIGVRIQIEDGGLRVTDIFPESPAAKAGFQVGDLIIESDGKPVKTTADLAGEKGQLSKVKLKRDKSELVLDVTRDTYRTVIPESLEWKENHSVAVVKIPTFDQGYNRSNVDSLMAEAKTAKMIVLDLRSNGGGMVINLQHLMSHFLDRENEPMGTFIGRAAVRRYEEKTGVKNASLLDIAKSSEDFRVKATATTIPVYTGKVTVLVNGGTGSASEMAAAAIREIKGGKVIGSKTAGAVLASMMMPLREGAGFWMQFPVTDYLTIKGFRIEGHGVEPDVMAAANRFGQEDEAITKAVALLKNDPSSK